MQMFSVNIKTSKVDCLMLMSMFDAFKVGEKLTVLIPSTIYVDFFYNAVYLLVNTVQIVYKNIRLSFWKFMY